MSSGGNISSAGACDTVKKSQSTSNKRGRKKTLSLNPEEREALENLIEEVILDGGMGDSESGSSDEENKVIENKTVSTDQAKETTETPLNNPKALASVKMPKKYYPGQLKVALKHMTDLPPRFSRKLKKAERYLELNAAAGSKKIMPPASIKEEDEEEMASINANVSNYDSRDVSPNMLAKNKNSKNHQIKDIKKTIRTLLTDLDQYVDENDRTSLSLDLPGAMMSSDLEKASHQHSTKGKYYNSGSQSSDDSMSSAASSRPLNAGNIRGILRPPYPSNHASNPQASHPRKISPTNAVHQLPNYRNTNHPAFNKPPPSSQHYPKVPMPQGMLPSNMDVPGVYFMSLPQSAPYYRSLPPQNLPMQPSFYQYPSQRYPPLENYLSYPSNFSSTDYMYQPPSNSNMASLGGHVNMQMPGSYNVLSDSAKFPPNYSQPPFFHPPPFQPPNYQSPNYQATTISPTIITPPPNSSSSTTPSTLSSYNSPQLTTNLLHTQTLHTNSTVHQFNTSFTVSPHLPTAVSSYQMYVTDLIC